MKYASALVLTLSLLILAVACRSDPRPYIEAGNKLFETGRYEEAALRYRKGLQKNPRYGEAYYRLALAELQLGQGTEALGALVQAAALLPRREDVQGKLADVLLAAYLKNPDAGRQVYQKLNEISGLLLAKNPNSYNGWRIKGYIAFLDKKLEEAASALAKANAAKPYDPELITSLSQALFQTNRIAEGEKLALNLLNRKKDYAPLYDVLYRLYMSTGRISDAEALSKRKSADNPKEPRYIVELAFHYLRTGRPKEVAATLASLLAREAEFPQARLYIGDFYTQSRDWERAIQTFRDGAEHSPKEKILYNKRTVSVLLPLRRLDEARVLIDSILREAPDDRQARIYHARLLIQTGNHADLQESIKELKTLVEDHPRDETLHFELGRAYHLDSKLDLSWTQFQQAARLRSDFVAALLALAEISQEKNYPEETLRFATDVLWFAPRDREARLLRCLGLIGTGRSDEADLALRAMLKDFPRDRNVRLQLGLLDIWNKKFDEAEAFFKSVHHPGSSDTAALEGLIENYGAQNHLDKAVSMLQQEAQLSKASIEVHKLLAKTAARARNYPVAITEYQRLAAGNPHSIEFQVRLGETYSEEGDFRNALIVLRKAQEAAPWEPEPVRALVTALIRAEMKPDAIIACRRLLALVPDDLGALNNLAFLLAETRHNAGEAVELAQKARQKAPDNATVADTLGWAFLNQGALDSALQVFRMLVEKYPNQPTYHYHFGAALLQKGRRDEARVELETALDKHPSLADAAKIKGLLAEILTGNARRS